MSAVAELAIQPEHLRKVVERAQTDPVWWITEILGGRPWARQREIVESVRDHRVTAVISCHGAGKDWIAARTILWFLGCFVPSIVIATAPTVRQVVGILWRELATAYRTAERRGFFLGGKLYTQELRFREDWRAFGFAAPEYDPDKFQGWHAEHILAVVDEASGVSKLVIEAIESALSSEHARLLLIGNPTDPTSEFGAIYKDAGTRRIRISAFDTPNFTTFGITPDDIAANTWERKITGPLPYPTLVTPHWVAERYRRWGPKSPAYIARVEGQFPESSADALIPYAWIEAAMSPERWERTKEGRPFVLGVDPARYGDAETVVVLRSGDRARVLETLTGMDTIQVARRVAQLQAEHEGSVIHIDTVGLGAGVYDYLKRIGRRVVPMEASRAADEPETHANARAQWYWRLRQRFQEGRIAVAEDDELRAQLSSITYTYDAKDRILIRSKEDMRRHGLPSPDRADALMLAFAEADTFSSVPLDLRLVEEFGYRLSPWRV